MKISVKLFRIAVGMYIFIKAKIKAKSAAIIWPIKGANAIAMVKKTAKKKHNFHKFIFLNLIIKSSSKVPIITAIVIQMYDVDSKVQKNKLVEIMVFLCCFL